VVYDKNGKELDGAYVKLDVLRGKEDSFTMMGYRIKALFYPDYYSEKGVEGSRSEEVKNPAFHLKIEKNGNLATEKSVRINEFAEFDNYRIAFVELPFWVNLLVVKEYGLEIIYAGFAIANIALIWRLIFFRREMVGSVRRSGNGYLLQLAGRSEFYRSLAEEEFEKDVARIGGIIKTGGVDAIGGNEG
jgi:cytochrome c biogenesis protein ResB